MLSMNTSSFCFSLTTSILCRSTFSCRRERMCGGDRSPDVYLYNSDQEKRGNTPRSIFSSSFCLFLFLFFHLPMNADTNAVASGGLEILCVKEGGSLFPSISGSRLNPLFPPSPCIS